MKRDLVPSAQLSQQGEVCRYYVGDPWIAAGRLVPLLERWSAPFPGYYLCYPERRQMAPILRAFIDAVRAVAAEDAP